MEKKVTDFFVAPAGILTPREAYLLINLISLIKYISDLEKKPRLILSKTLCIFQNSNYLSSFVRLNKNLSYKNQIILFKLIIYLFCLIKV
ncbi:MAG: hypothetical protein C4582_06300 [Desulfobacteraceae bacterium]|nr:MAG: hypothetical protein C4582_06300 [Desulfobacteraceae bacterium]